MTAAQDHLQSLRQLNELAAFNRWCGIEVLEAESGRVVIALDWRPEFAQYVGFMHAGVVGALIDTACELFASAKGKESLVATGETLLSVTSSETRAQSAGSPSAAR